MHFPSDPLQPGPIYFLTTRKYSVFGVCCEAISGQINFITDESGETGKGANAVIGRLHFFFENHGLSEKDIHLHANNFAGQNKNNLMVQNLMWRTLTGRHSTVHYSFPVVGHTKFAPDSSFGLFKRLFKRTKVGSIAEIEEVGNQSAVLQCSTGGLP